MARDFLGNFKTVSIIAIILLLAGSQGCNHCTEAPVNPNDYSGDIIFTGKGLNSDKPGIFSVREDGSNLNEIVPNAQMFSPVSSESTFVYLSVNDKNQPSVWLYDLKTQTKQVLIGPGQYGYNIIKFPVISPNGKYIAFFAGTDSVDQVVSVNVAKPSPKSITLYGSSGICPNSLPAFSPDGQYIAFFIGENVTQPLIIQIVNADDPSQKSKDTVLAFGIHGLPTEDIMNWTHKDMIAYSIDRIFNQKRYYYIGVWNIPDGSKSFEISDSAEGAFNPILSSDQKSLIFTDLQGNLWQWQSDFGGRFSSLTSIDESQYIAYPREKSDGSAILYIKFYRNNDDIYAGQLKIIKFDKFSNNKTYLSVCNNVNRAFWR